MENQLENNFDRWITRTSSVLVAISITASIFSILLYAALSMGAI